jgi:polyisoprenoid-binding protein YceI
MKAHLTIKTILAWTILLLSWLPQVVVSQVVETKKGKVEFTSHVPLHTFSGVSKELVGKIDFATGTVDFYVDLSSLKTGIGKRDKDMRTTLEVDQYPFAEFFGSFTKPMNLDLTSDLAVEVKGDFSIHGVSKEVTITGTLKKKGLSWQLDASWSLLLSDYNIEPPKLLIMKVDEKQDIRISSLLSPESK